MFSIEQPRWFIHYKTNLKRKDSHIWTCFFLKRYHLWGKLECFKILNGFRNVDPTKLFVMDDSTGTRNNGAKLKCRQVHSDYTNFFTNSVIRDWNRLQPSMVQCNRIAFIKNNPDSISSISMFTGSFSVSWWLQNNFHLGFGQITYFGQQRLCDLIIYVIIYKCTKITRPPAGFGSMWSINCNKIWRGGGSSVRFVVWIRPWFPLGYCQNYSKNWHNNTGQAVPSFHEKWKSIGYQIY